MFSHHYGYRREACRAAGGLPMNEGSEAASLPSDCVGVSIWIGKLRWSCRDLVTVHWSACYNEMTASFFLLAIPAKPSAPRLLQAQDHTCLPPTRMFWSSLVWFSLCPGSVFPSLGLALWSGFQLVQLGPVWFEKNNPLRVFISCPTFLSTLKDVCVV